MDDLTTRRSDSALEHGNEDVESLTSVLRSITRTGIWEPPETMHVVSVLGSVKLDFEDAELLDGVTAVDCEVYLGNIEIVVPSDVDLEISGSVFLGSVETKDGRGRFDWRDGVRRALGRIRNDPSHDGPDEPDEDDERPLLSIDCSGVMGNVEITLL